MIHISCSGQSITLSTDTPLVANTIGKVQFAVTLDAEWAGLNVDVVFAGSGVVKTVLYTGPADVPWEVLQSHGRLNICCVGRSGSVQYPTMQSKTASLPIYQSGPISGEEPLQEPSPDVSHQALEIAKEAKEAAITAQDSAIHSAESAQSSAQQAAKTAETVHQDKLASGEYAQAAKEAAGSAQRAAQSAYQSAQDAEEALRNATLSEQNAQDSANNAAESARASQDAAQEATAAVSGKLPAPPNPEVGNLLEVTEVNPDGTYNVGWTAPPSGGGGGSGGTVPTMSNGAVIFIMQ